VPVSHPSESRAEENSPLQARSPGLNVGMEVLGRGSFTLDLGHGRIWFPPKTISAPILVNRSGLELEFVLDQDGERLLRVDRIREGSPATKLQAQGLKPGSVVTRVNGVESDDLDLWQVEQLLSGASGLEVTVQWKAPKNLLKMAPIKLRPLQGLQSL